MESQDIAGKFEIATLLTEKNETYRTVPIYSSNSGG